MDNFYKLKKRIKKNEGYCNKIYTDQLGNLTVGYGHLIKKSKNLLLNKKYPKKYLNSLFENDFNLAVNNFKKHYKKNNFSKNVQEVLIEMIFQMGIKKLLKFKRFNKFLKKKLFYLASLEMIDSLWYSQTPRRVERLIKVLLRAKNDK